MMDRSVLRLKWNSLGGIWKFILKCPTKKNLNFGDFFRYFLDFYSKIPENPMIFWKIGKIFGEFGDFWWNSSRNFDFCLILGEFSICIKTKFRKNSIGEFSTCDQHSQSMHDSFYVIFYLYVLIFIIGRRKGSIFLTGI